MTRTKTLLSITPLLLLLTLSGCISLAEDITPPPGMVAPPPPLVTPETMPTAITMEPVLPNNSPDAEHGAIIYIDKCAPCHGETGMGDGPDADILENSVPALGSTALARISAPLDWFTMVTQGNMSKFMPPFSSLSDQERWDVVAYLYTLTSPPEEVALGETLFLVKCAECHGEDGKQGVVDFADQAFMSERTAEEMVATITDGQGLMPAFGDLTEEERWALTTYLRSLAYLPVEMGITPDTSEVVTDVQDLDIPSDAESASTSDTATTFDGFGKFAVGIVNPSNDGLPSDLAVTLHGYDEMVEVYTQTLTLAKASEITFEGVPLPSGRMYFATIEHAKAVYGSDVLVLDPDSPDELALEITYYPPTTDKSILHVDRLHLLLSFMDEETLEIFQIYIFSNPTNQVLTPFADGETAVNFVIPPDANELNVEESMSIAYKKTSSGFGIVNVYPEEAPYQTVFSYQIPYKDRKLDLSIPISMDANAVIVMSPADGFKVRSDQLEDAGSRNVEGVSYNMYTGMNFITGNNLDLALSGRPKADTIFIATAEDSNTNLVIGLAGLGGALIVAGITLWYRNRADEDDLLDEDWEDDIYGDLAEDIMDAIITLDDQYKTGGLPEGAYQVRRAELKERLGEIIRGE